MLSLTSLSSLLLPSLSLIYPLSRLPCHLFTPSLPSPTPLAFSHAPLTLVAQALFIHLTKIVEETLIICRVTKRKSMQLTRLEKVPPQVLAAAEVR